MDVGIVIVNFNSGAYLYRCIKSLLLSDVPIQIVIVDNNSKDTSIADISELIAGKNYINIVTNPENVGFSTAVNIGIGFFEQGQQNIEAYFILNPDCQVHPHTVGMLLDSMRKSPKIGIVGALVFNDNGTEQRGCRRREPTLRRSMISALGLGRRFEGVDMNHLPLSRGRMKVDAVSGAAMLVSRNCMEKLGGMDEGYFLHCEDLDLCRRARKHGFKVILETRVSVFHRQGVSGGLNYATVEKHKHRGMLRYYSHHSIAGSSSNRFLVKIIVWMHYYVTIARARLFSAERESDNSNSYVPYIDVTVPYTLVSGINSDVGDALIKQKSIVADNNFLGVFRSNGKATQATSIPVLCSSYFSKAPVRDRPRLRNWINLAPIWSSSKLARIFKEKKLEKIIALSSTSITTKSRSRNRDERRVVQQLVMGEEDISMVAKEAGACLTILRPTMIYGGKRNRNINLIGSIIRYCRFFPLVGKGNGLRQPVHAEDVATACVTVLNRDEVRGIYTISGNEVLSFREMIIRVFESLGVKVRFIHVPFGLIAAILSVVNKIFRVKAITPEMAARMKKDLIFPHEEAKRDFNFNPQNFNP